MLRRSGEGVEASARSSPRLDRGGVDGRDAHPGQPVSCPTRTSLLESGLGTQTHMAEGLGSRCHLS